MAKNLRNNIHGDPVAWDFSNTNRQGPVMSKERAFDLIRRLATDGEFRSRLKQTEAAGKRELLDRSGFGEVGVDDLRAAGAALRNVPRSAGAAKGNKAWATGEAVCGTAAFGSVTSAAAFGASAFGASAFGASAFGASAFAGSAFASSAFGSSAFGASAAGGTAVA
ncbi:hypothetical protein J2847_000389 [Azospirillum agricola]|uniref:hypothetical protein n=1 Tax=Azospirillum agricola TaxID=1720247 RepID=UPI001AEB6C39|nr:hypothetical protein [Azospirillum agricola]MBP2227122.1 hypothetical protein [Azospirillum agricola]